MIEGLKVTVNGAELRDLCIKQSQYHQARAEAYQTQLTSLKGITLEPSKFSSGDPTDQLKNKVESHTFSAAELHFISEHVVITESYLLDDDDLRKIGIGKHGYY